ncbi:uncharacterized protein LOC132904108 [Amyelois transitella]|uniref:uncharacterized protein LOC132904108 n=1 Tax=Amyelois transitella TaxID=680683 RepID=UPI0029905289|nr:uncharacterized protein LOC132904108 [Amyelois transitella]
MTSLEAVQQIQKSLQTDLLRRMTEFENQLKMSKEPASLNKLWEDYSKFKSDVRDIMQLLQQQLEELVRSVDNIEMRHRRRCLLFGGIKEAENGANEDASAVISAILGERFHMEGISSSSFEACHRMGSKNNSRPRPILVRFVCPTIKNTVWRKKTVLKGTTTVVSEFLTRRRQALFTEARRRFGMTKCWTFDGSIFVKPPSGKPISINALEDLDQAGNAFAETAPVASSSGTGVVLKQHRQHPPKTCEVAPGSGDRQQRAKRATTKLK